MSGLNGKIIVSMSIGEGFGVSIGLKKCGNFFRKDVVLLGLKRD